MVNNVNLNTPEARRQNVVRQAAGYAIGGVVGLATGFVAENSIGKMQLKDEFKKAKTAIKDAKAQDAGKEAVKTAKQGLKELRKQVSKNSLATVKKMAGPIAASVAGFAVVKEMVLPAVMNYFYGDKK